MEVRTWLVAGSLWGDEFVVRSSGFEVLEATDGLCLPARSLWEMSSEFGVRGSECGVRSLSRAGEPRLAHLIDLEVGGLELLQGIWNRSVRVALAWPRLLPSSLSKEAQE